MAHCLLLLAVWPGAEARQSADDSKASACEVLCSIDQAPVGAVRPVAGTPAGRSLAGRSLERFDAALLFELLADGCTSCGTGDPMPLSDAARGLLLTGIASAGREEALGLLRADSAPRTAGEFRASIEVLGRIGRAADLPLLIRTSAGAWGGGEAPRAIGSGLEQALVEIIARDASGLDFLGSCWESARPGQIACMLRGLGRTKDPRVLGWLCGRLGIEGFPRALVLEQIDRLAREVGPPFDAKLAERVRPCLRSEAEAERAAAAGAAGSLRDDEAVPLLVDLLRSGSATESAAALQALRNISDLNLPADHRTWRRWLEQERAWWRERSEAAFAVLDRGERAELVATVGEISTRRLHREELVLRLQPLALDDDPAVRALACHALAQLGTTAAWKPLIQRMGDVDEGVVRAAHSALTTLTRLDLPPHREAWLAALEPKLARGTHR